MLSGTIGRTEAPLCEKRKRTRLVTMTGDSLFQEGATRKKLLVIRGALKAHDHAFDAEAWKIVELTLTKRATEESEGLWHEVESAFDSTTGSQQSRYDKVQGAIRRVLQIAIVVRGQAKLTKSKQK